MSNYRFNSKGHRHELQVDGEWKPLTGCTTILSVVAKPALIFWSARMACDYVRDNLKDLSEIEQVLEEAKVAHRKKRDKAGDWGTAVHAWIENWIGTIKNGEEPPKLPEEAKQREVCERFVKWAADNKVKFLESEKHVYSEKLWLGGIVDIVCEIDGKIWLADIKTSSGIYEEAFFQMAGYQLMIEEMGLYKDIAGHIVLNLRKDGKFEEKRSISNKENREAFLAALKLYRVKEKIKNQVIK